MTDGFRTHLAAAMAAVVMGAAPAGLAQDAKPPASAVGISVPQTSTLELGEQIPELDGYRLQIRTIVLQPDAHSYYHSHARRPVVAYLVSGDYTEHRDGEDVVSRRPGEQWVEGADVAHWSENRGGEPAVLINVEVMRPRTQ